MYVNVSDVATFIGQTKWDIVTPFERFWKNNDKSYNETTQELQKQGLLHSDTGLTKMEKIEKYISPETLKVLSDNTKTPKEKKEEILKSIDNELENADVLVECVNSTVNTTHGIESEEKVANAFNVKRNVTLQRDNKLYKKQFMEGSFLCGRVDGLHDDYIVEIKNRMNGFFNRVRDYENTQVQMYMWILGDREYTILEECYKGETKSTMIYKDTDYIEYVIELLVAFIVRFTEFIKTGDKEEYFKKTDFQKGVFIRKMIGVSK
jgi:hypothetical protein